MANDINIVVSAQVGDATRGLQQVQKQVQQVDRKIKQSTVALKQNANQFNATAVSTNKFAKGALQQAGYQVGDFAVQLSGGQNALQAFGQQGSQLLGIFGPVGAVLGAAVAIFAAVGVAAQRASQASAGATREFMRMDQVDLGSIRAATSDLRTIQKSYNDAIQDGGSASSSAARLTIANSEKEFNARKQLVSIERQLLVLRSQDQISALRNLQEQQERTRANAIEIARNIGPNATFDVSAATGGFAGAAPSINQLETALGGTLEQLRNNRREILQLESELTNLGIASDEAEAAVNMEFDPTGGLASIADTATGGASALRSVRDVVKNELNPELKRIVDIQNAVSSSVESGLMAMVDGTQSVKDAFRSMASEIIKELYRIFVVKRITGMIAGFAGDVASIGGGSFFSGIAGAPVAGARAMGGQVTGGRAYMVGERGPEMIVPQRNGNVVPNNQLGGGVTVVQNINVSTGVQQTVRAEIKTLMPQIAEASKAAVADAVRRGGSYGRAFA